MGKAFAVLAVVVAMLAVAASAYGWVHNIALLLRDTGEIGVITILRAAGIFVVPLGVILGYL